MHSIHATVHQMQLLRSSGALKGAYCKLVKITDAVKLCKSFGLGVPDNVKAECQNYEEVKVVEHNCIIKWSYLCIYAQSVSLCVYFYCIFFHSGIACIL